MCDLTMQKWEAVIVDWVNCLEIAKRVQDIKALKSGEFFKTLLDLLQPGHSTDLGGFLHTYYPNLKLSGDDGTGDIAHFTDADLTATASVLLHFMCMHDRREELISPLCRKLSGGVQAFIKYFLEHFSQDTTAAQFNDVVRKAIECEPSTNILGTPKKSMEWNSSGESPFICNSPLVEYFKTPAAKSAKFQEKERELRRLQRELQLERDEKEDLNVEIAEQKQRIQKISQEVHEKSVSISNLSARLAEIEEQPPTNKPRELIDIEKLLRSELADAQQYICELQSEHGELTFRKEEISKKLQMAEESSCMWQGRALQYESKLDEALAKCKAQEQELTLLQINYNELSTLLDELRQNKTNNSTLELDNSVTAVSVEPKSSEENLADTVVEIQLKECQLEMLELQNKLANQIEHSTTVDENLKATMQELKECQEGYQSLQAMKHDVDMTLDKYILTNDKLEGKVNQLAKDYTEVTETNKKLQDLLQTSIDESQKLEDELIDVKSKLNDVKNSHHELQGKNDELLQQFNSLKQSEVSLLKVNTELVTAVENMTKVNVAKDEELETLKSHLLEREKIILSNEEFIINLKKDLGEMQNLRDDFEVRLEEKNRMFEVLKEESRCLQQKYEEAADQISVGEFTMEALKKQIKDNDNKLQVNIDRLEQLINGSIEDSKLEKYERIHLLLDKLEQKQTTFEVRIVTLEQLNRKFEEQLDLLSKEDLNNKNCLEEVQKLLSRSQDTIKAFECEVRDKNQKIQDLDSRLELFDDTLKELEELKSVISRRDSDVLRLESLLDNEKDKIIDFTLLKQDLEKQIDDLQEICEQKQSKTEELEKQVVCFNSSVVELQELKENLLVEIASGKQLNQTLNANFLNLESRFDALQFKHDAYADENNVQSQKIQSLNKENSELLDKLEALRNLVSGQAQHHDELMRTCEDLEVKIVSLQNNCEEKQGNIHLLTKSLELAQGDVERKNKTIEDLNVDVRSQSQRNGELKSKVESLDCDNNLLELDIKQKQNRIDALLNDIDSLNCELSETQGENDCNKKMVEELNLEVKEKAKKVKELEAKIKTLSLDVEQLGLDNKQSKSVIDTLTSDTDALICELSSTKDENVNSKNMINDLSFEVIHKSKKINELEAKLEDLDCESKELINGNLERQNQIEALTNDIIALNSDLGKAKEEIASNKCTINDLSFEVKDKNQKINELQLSITDLDCERKQLNDDNLQGQNQIVCLTKDIEDLNCKLSSTKNEIVINKKKIKDLNSDLKKQAQKNVELTAKVEQLDLERKQLKNDNAQQQSQILSLTSDIDQLAHDLKLANEQNSADKDSIKELTCEVNNYANQNQKLVFDIEHLKDERKQIQSNNSKLQDQINVLHSEVNLSKKTLEELMAEIDSQLIKLKNKDSELAFIKEEYSSKDLETMQTINELNQKISFLQEGKANLESDLVLAKDEIALKKKELEDLSKAKSQLDKQKNKTIKQLEKKIELLQLTTTNLEKQLNKGTVDMEDLVVQLADESSKIQSLTAEKGKLFAEYNQTKNELTALKLQLQAKEKDCECKDDIIERTTVELLSIKLDIEMRTNELKTLKSTISAIKKEKSGVVVRCNELKEELDLVNKKFKNMSDELQTVNDMKTSLASRIDHFKENMQTVFNHFDIKKKNMKQSLEELKKYKCNKEKEIKQLTDTLVEVRGEVEHLKEENDLVRKELNERIEVFNKHVINFEVEVEALKTTETGYLQEIAMLKEELNYTIDKYTDALTEEKELKAENDLQIQTLTESLHEMLEKFNALDREHSELTDALAYNKRSVEEIKGEKDSLELEIVRLKNEYEEDAKNCTKEFENELGTLKKIEATLIKDVAELKELLEQSQSDGSTISRELSDAKAQLHIIQCEKAEVVNKLDELVLSSSALRKDYDNLKIAKEAYMKESKAKLIETQDLLQEQKQSSQLTIAQKDKEIHRLKKDCTKYLDRIKREEESFKRDIEKRQKEAQELHTSIANFLQNIETLTKEKDGLKKKIVAMTKEKDDMGCDITSLQAQIQNLQISHDVLEAGKAKMENMLHDLQDRYAALENELIAEKQQFEVSKGNLQSQLDRAFAQIRENEATIKSKCNEINAANEDFESVQSILTNMTKKMEASSRQLTIIHEDYEGKLKSERESFNELKEQYNTARREMEYMNGLNAGLTSELEDAHRERSEVEAALREKEEFVAELQQKYDRVVGVVGAKDASLASLQAELADRMGKLADTSTARHALEDAHRRATAQLAEVESQKEELIERHARALRAVEENLLQTESEVREVVKRLDEANCGRGEIERLLAVEREAKSFLERRVADLESKVYDANAVKMKLTSNVKRLNALLQEKESNDMDEEELDSIISETERRIIVVFGKLRDLEAIKGIAEQDKENSQRALDQMEKCNQQLVEDKAKLLEKYEQLHEEKAALMQDKAKESKSFDNLKMQYESLRQEQTSSTNLQQKLEQLQANNKHQCDLYSEFLKKSQVTFKVLESMVTERNAVEQVVLNLREQYTTLQIKSSHVTEDSHKLHYEQKCALEIIIDDIQKQFRRLSKMIYNLNLKSHKVVDRAVTAILEDKSPDWSTLFQDISGEEIIEKLDDLKDNVNNTQVQLEAFFVAIEALVDKEDKPRVLKENILPRVKEVKEDEWKKKYLSVKNKLTLVENAKTNFEKKIKQLRDENKRLQSDNSHLSSEKVIKREVKSELKQEQVKQVEVVNSLDNDEHYKKLLQEYIQLKQHFQDDIKMWTDKCKKLETQVQDLTETKCPQSQPIDSPELADLQNELFSLKGSYREVKIAYSKLQLDYSAIEQILNERNEQLTTLTATVSKDSCNLGEENTKLKSEIDTLKYKRQKEREQLLQHVKKLEDKIKKLDAELSEKRSELAEKRTENDLKLERMKEKIVTKYKEQVDEYERHRYEKMAQLQEENSHIKNTVVKLKEELAKVNAKNELLFAERQYEQMKVRRDDDKFDFKEPAVLSRRASSHSLHSDVRNTYVEERRSTLSLPRNVQSAHTHQGMDIIEEVRYRRASNIAPRSVADLQMEDEDDMFNTKYLHELKEGRPSIANTGRESSSSRLSEMAYRNSLCPPHLKSSYPAETQFLNHAQFKDDDLKSGNIDFMDDMKTQLLPTEKSVKKYAGTTSYKRPGPPTPSKNGGRLSLQGNERVLRETGNDQKQRVTPNPLRSLFSSSSKKVAAASLDGGGNGENTVASPKKRPSLSFFRR